MDLGLAGKTAIVTGGGSNIGRGIALGFAREGANVVIAELDEKAGQKVADLITKEGGKAKAIKTDVVNYDSVQAMVKAALDEFGKIDILVNNVGWDDFAPFLQGKPNWDKYINLNFRQQLNCMHAVLPHMIERKYGHIVNIGSDAGRIGEFMESVYAGCKGGVIALSKAVAREVGRYGITINVVCPGVTIPEPKEQDEVVGEYSMFRTTGETWQKLGKLFPPEQREKLAKASYPLRRGGVAGLGTPEDIADAVLFFASDRSSFVTGQTLSVSGGYTMV